MLPIEGLFCPCCTPAILHTIAQSSSHLFSKQTLMLGTGALVAALVQERQANFPIAVERGSGRDAYVNS